MIRRMTAAVRRDVQEEAGAFRVGVVAGAGFAAQTVDPGSGQPP